jgi:hypothetical protein
MKFGHLKSKIEKHLFESYGKNSFKDELKVFKQLVLENKTLKKLFFVYDELNTNKGYTKEIADQFINECIIIYENTINKINPKDLKVLELWVDDVKSENQYDDIDNLFSTNILTLENKIKSRKIISESLIKKSKDENSDVINLPISTMVNIANQTINKYISELNESDKKSLISLLKEDDNKLNSEFDILKIDIISKLNEIKKVSDIETSKRIDESIEKITTEKYDKLTYFKLKNLKENL